MSTAAISIEHLTKDFRIGIRGFKLRAVEDLSLDIEENEIFGLLGPNGCGKSTTMKVVLGLLRPTAGSCRIFGTNCTEVSSRSDVGFLPEAPYFQRYLTGYELVKLGAEICGVSSANLKPFIAEALEIVGMGDAAQRRVGTYSKGMLQRIGIAQAIVHQPRLIVLDEPTAGVDPLGAAQIAELILSLKKQGKTVLLCSHLLAQVEGLCDRVGIMNQGKLVLQGTVSELLQQEGRSSLLVEACSSEALAEIQAVLTKHGGRLLKEEASQVSLEKLFLRETGTAQPKTSQGEAAE